MNSWTPLREQNMQWLPLTPGLFLGQSRQAYSYLFAPGPNDRLALVFPRVQVLDKYFSWVSDPLSVLMGSVYHVSVPAYPN